VAARVRDLVGAPADDAPAVRTHANETQAWVPGMRPPPRHGGGGGGETERWRDRLRWDPGRRGLIALALAVVVVLAATGWWLAAGRPTAMPITATGPAPTDSTGAAGSSPVSAVSVMSSALPSLSGASTPGVVPAASGGAVVVDVAGKVRRPGVYTLPSGARVYEALRAAGGVRRGANTLSLNLAAVLQDGQQIVVGAPAGAVAPIPVTGSGGVSAPAALINLNTATLEELESLPGVGPVLGQNILDWRAAHQQFTSVDQLSDVTGIGDVRLAQLRPLVTV
jgi:competence protein ComEA